MLSDSANLAISNGFGVLCIGLSLIAIKLIFSLIAEVRNDEEGVVDEK